MAEFTKEQLIELALENVRVLRLASKQHPAQPVIAMDLRLAEIALAALTAEPAGWTDEEELRDVDRGGCGYGYLFTCKPVTPHADERRVIKLYRLPEIE